MKAADDINIEATQKAIDAIYMLMQDFALQYKNKLEHLKSSLLQAENEKEFFGEYYTKDENFADFCEQLGLFVEGASQTYSTNIGEIVSEYFDKIKPEANPDDSLSQQLTDLLKTLPLLHQSLLENLNSISSGITIADQIIKTHFKGSSLENNLQYSYINKIREQLNDLVFYNESLETNVMHLEKVGTGFLAPICKMLTQNLRSNIHQYTEEYVSMNSVLNNVLLELIDTERTCYTRLDMTNKFFVDNEGGLKNINGLYSNEYADIFKSICELQAKAFTIEAYILQKLGEEKKDTINSLDCQDKLDIMRVFEVYLGSETTQALSIISSTATRIMDPRRKNNRLFLDKIASTKRQYNDFNDAISYPGIRFLRISMLLERIVSEHAKIKIYENSPLLKEQHQKLASLYNQFKRAAKEINENTQYYYHICDLFYNPAYDWLGIQKGDIADAITAFGGAVTETITGAVTNAAGVFTGAVASVWNMFTSKSTDENNEDKGQQPKNKGPGQ